MTLRPFGPQEFDPLWAAVAGADPTVAVGAMDPELLRSRLETSGQLTERLAARLFDEAGARRLEAGTALDNAAMRRVLKRVGFRQEGILRRWYPSDDGAGIDRVMYGMTRDDYEDVNTRWT